MRRCIRWTLWFLAGLAIVLLALLLLIDPLARRTAEKRLSETLGLEVRIERLSIGMRSSTVNVRGLRILNGDEFGGEMLRVSKLHAEFDRDRLANRKLLLTTLRLDVTEISVITNQLGRINWDALGKRERNEIRGAETRSKRRSVSFEGIDLLEITWRGARLERLHDPVEKRRIEIGIENEVFHTVRTREDFTAVATVLTLRSGMNLPWPKPDEKSRD